MNGSHFDAEELRFLEETGLDPKDLEAAVTDAPPLPAGMLERIQEQARAKAGLSATARPGRHGRSVPRWAAIAAGLLVGLGATVAAVGPDQAQAALRRFFHWVPGIGITETSQQTLVLREPVTVRGSVGELTVTGLVSSGQFTRIQFAMSGLPLQKVDGPRTNEPTLTLPDGRRMNSRGMQFAVGAGTASGTLWFDPLPADTRSVTLDVPGQLGLTEPFQLVIPVLPAEEAGLVEANRGGWSAERYGVKLGAPYVAAHGDRVTAELEPVVARKGARVEGLGEWNNQRAAVLTDNLGRSYELIPGESSLGYSTVSPLTVTFAGPVPADADSLRLTVPVLQLQETGEATVRVKLDDWGVVPLNRKVTVGRYSFTIKTVTRVAPDQFRFDLDMGPEQDGVMLREVRVRAKSQPHGSSHSFQVDEATGQTQFIQVEAPVKGDSVEVVFYEPVVQVQGPWEMELPVK